VVKIPLSAWKGVYGIENSLYFYRDTTLGTVRSTPGTVEIDLSSIPGDAKLLRAELWMRKVGYEGDDYEATVNAVNVNRSLYITPNPEGGGSVYVLGKEEYEERNRSHLLDPTSNHISYYANFTLIDLKVSGMNATYRELLNNWNTAAIFAIDGSRAWDRFDVLKFCEEELAGDLTLSLLLDPIKPNSFTCSYYTEGEHEDFKFDTEAARPFLLVEYATESAPAIEGVDDSPAVDLPAESTLTRKLKELRALLDEGLISQDDYDSSKQSLLAKYSGESQRD
jgi:hypothetical protein